MMKSIKLFDQNSNNRCHLTRPRGNGYRRETKTPIEKVSLYLTLAVVIA